MSGHTPERVEYTHRYSTKSSSSPSSAAPPDNSEVRTKDGKLVRGIDIRRASPMPLNATQESEVRDLYYKRVRDKCADEIRGMLCLRLCILFEYRLHAVRKADELEGMLI